MKLDAERRSSLFLFLVVLLALGLRVYHLGYSPLWLDEGYSRLYAENSLAYLWTTGFHLETNPPAYYSVLHFWIERFGASEFALRFPSVLASLVAIVVVYALGKELENRSVGLLAALLMALAPTEIWYAQEARAYTLLHAAVAVALLGMARYLGPSRSWSGLLLYGLGAAGAIYCHDTAVLFVLAVNLAVVGLAWHDRTFISRRDLVRWLGANVAVGLAALPWILVMLQHPNIPGVLWMPPVTISELTWVMRDVVGGPAANREFLHGHSFCYLLLLALAGLLCWQRKLDRRELIMLVAAPLIFIMTVVLLSLHQSILISRIFFWTWIPLSLLLAHLLFQGGKARILLLIPITLVFAIGLDGLYFPYFTPKENWRELMESNREELARADVIVLTAPVQIGCFAYYFPEGLPRAAFWFPQRAPSSQAIIDFSDRFHIPKLDTEGLRQMIQSGKRVCALLVNHDPAYFAASFAALPPPDRSFEDTFPRTYEFHLLTWNGRDRGEKRLDGQERSP